MQVRGARVTMERAQTSAQTSAHSSAQSSEQVSTSKGVMRRCLSNGPAMFDPPRFQPFEVAWSCSVFEFVTSRDCVSAGHDTGNSLLTCPQNQPTNPTPSLDHHVFCEFQATQATEGINQIVCRDVSARVVHRAACKAAAVAASQQRTTCTSTSA